MPETKRGVRLAKVAKEINVGIDTIVEHLKKKGFDGIEPKPTTKLTAKMYDLLLSDFRNEIKLKEKAEQINFRTRSNDNNPSSKNKSTEKSGQLPTIQQSTTTNNNKITSTEKIDTTTQKTSNKKQGDNTQNPSTKQDLPKQERVKKNEPTTDVEPDKNNNKKLSDTIKTPIKKDTSSVEEEIKLVVDNDVEALLEELELELGLNVDSNKKTKETKKTKEPNKEKTPVNKTVEKQAKKETAQKKPLVEPEIIAQTPKTEPKVKVEKTSTVVQKSEEKTTPPIEEKVTGNKTKKPASPTVKKTEEVKSTVTPTPPKAVIVPPVEPKVEKKTTTPKVEKTPTSKPSNKEVPVASTPTVTTSENKKAPKVTAKKTEDTKTKTGEDTRRTNTSSSNRNNRKSDQRNNRRDNNNNTKSSKRDKRSPQKDLQPLQDKKSTVTNKSKEVTPKNNPPAAPKLIGQIDNEAVKKRETNPKDYGVVGPKVVGKIDLDSLNLRTRPERKKKRGSSNNKRRGTDSTGNSGDPKKKAANGTTPNTSGTGADRRKRRRKRIIKTDGSRPSTGTNSGSNSNSNNSQDRRTSSSSGSGGSRSGGPSNRSGGPRYNTGSRPPFDRNNRNNSNNRDSNNRKRPRRGKKTELSPEVSEKEIQDKIKATMAKLSGGGRNNRGSRSKLRRQKREQAADKRELLKQSESNILQVTEFISVNELAKIMEVPVTQVITVCFNLGIIVSINQRLDAEVIELVADEFEYQIEFIGATEQDEELEEEQIDTPEQLKDRAPIVTIMGHVDHGKTSLLDYIRRANVVAGEVGGITQHIGAYEVTTESGKQITFLDTPGHEAFTAMRARGAKVTDIAVIVVAADDSVMPQTKEAISHAQAAGVPMIFAINKIDREESNPDRIKEQLAGMNILLEDWGGKYQSQDISAKNGTNIDDLLEKILLEAEVLELKANPDRAAVGTVVEAALDKGRGYVATILVEKGTLNVGDIVIAGQYTGRIKAMFNERGTRVKDAGPATPILVLGLNGAPQAGDKIKVMSSEQEARSIAQKRQQIIREQQQRAHKHITLEEIGRRLALGNFKELNLIVKGDFDGSVEALCDSLQKLSTEEVQVRIIHRAVGPIIESDVLLASASDAIIIGFQVRPTSNARRQAEQENIDVRLYSIIYDAIEEIELAMEGMLEPTVEEKFVCSVDVREVFKISKVGTVAGCYVTEGKVARDTKIRLVRDGIVAYTGEISALKRYKDDIKEVPTGMECGISIKNFNDIKVGDVIEGYEQVEVKRKLK